MANKNLFKDAIADAKTLKELSLENAKKAIEEAFSPRIQEMFRLKLSEMEELEEADEVDEYAEIQPEDEKEAHRLSEEGDLDESTLDEILAELELEEAEDETMEEGKKGLEEAKGDDEEEEGEAEEAEEAEETEEDEELEVAELTVQEFTDLVKDVLADVLGAQQGGAAEEGDLEGGEDLGGEDETIDLAEILAELEEESGDSALEEAKKKHKKKEDEEEKEELKEAIKTINVLKTQLSEINLLNAKLLYVNKLFKSKSLTEAQKVKVISAFDRATTIAEAKNTYATLKESFGTSTKKAPIKESLGFASKPIGSAPARPIVEADAYVTRMQQLAGLKQPNI